MEISTALMLTLPHPVQRLHRQLQQQIREDVPAHFVAHITVLAPFVPYAELDDHLPRLREVCASVAPFKLTLAGYGFFPQIVYLPPADPQPLHDLLAAIQAAFPGYLPYAGEYGTDYKPHATLFIGDSVIDPATYELPQYDPMTFTVKRLDVLSGVRGLDNDLPWLTEAVIPLGMAEE